jgi:hypothetical protein
MQAMKWQRETLERLNAELLEENKRLRRINFGRVIAVVFFLTWAAIACNYLTSTPASTQSYKCSAKAYPSNK